MTRPPRDIVLASSWLFGLRVWAGLALMRWRNGSRLPAFKVRDIEDATALRPEYLTWYRGGDAKVGHMRAVFETSRGVVRQVLLVGVWPEDCEARKAAARFVRNRQETNQ